MNRADRYKRRGTSTSRVIRKMSIFFVIMITIVLSVSSYKLALASSSSNYTYQRVIVEKGDTLWGLAARSNHNSNIQLLVHKTMQYNNLANTYIQPGQEIYIPTRL